MRKLTFFMLAVGLVATLFTACKKDEDHEIPAGGAFTVEGQSYPTDIATWSTSNGLVIKNIGVSPDYIENYVRVIIDSLNYPTYTYLSRNNGAYDAKKNFSSAEVRYNKTNVAGQGTDITGVTAGTINVKKEGADLYSIEYNITVDNKVVSGRYRGKIVK